MNKSRFFFRYLFRGLIWIAVIIGIFILLKDNPWIRDADWLTEISRQEWLVYLVFTASEIVFGLLPPEFFMIWSLHNGISGNYVLNVLFLFGISYLAGIAGYYIGYNFSKTRIFHRIYERFLYKYENLFRRFSGFVLFVGAVTPLPFSAVCMLVGTIKYPQGMFYLITSARIFRFAVYGYLIWQVNAI